MPLNNLFESFRHSGAMMFHRDNAVRHFHLFAFMAALLLFLGDAAEVYSHICLDGQEPAVSLHFEALAEHHEHAPDDEHVDYEQEISQLTLLTKLFDAGKLAVIPSGIEPVRQSDVFAFALPPYYIQADLQSVADCLPPQRAPPRLHLT